MSLVNIQLATMYPAGTADGRFNVAVLSNDRNALAMFSCSSERAAAALRDAIREHADSLRHVANYREIGAPSARERRASERRFTGEPPTGFGEFR